jgi:ABC-2 type transport system permease protein
MWTIATRELRSLFLSPLAWSILGIIQFILGWIFAVLVSEFTQPDFQSELANHPDAPGLTDIVVSSLFGWIGIVLLLVAPLLTMRLISEERHNKTLPLLLSAPIPMTSIILGKYLGLMGFFLIMLATIMLMPLSLLLGGTLDFGQIASGLVGVTLLLGAFTAIGLYISTLTAHPTVAAIGTFGILLLLWIIAENAGEQTGVLTYLAITTHYQPLLKGIFNSQDVVYYLLVIALFLILSIQKLDADRI